MEVQHDIAEYPPLEREHIEVIYNKKEFKLLRDKFLKNYQLIVTRYLSAQTGYNNVLLFHEMGTGKTCTAVSVIENIKENNYKLISEKSDTKDLFQGAVVVTKNETLITEFKHAIVNVCARDQYYSLKYENARNVKQLNKYFNDVLKFYRFYTYDTFTTSQLGPLSNMIIVLDEAHFSYSSSDDTHKNEDTYNKIHDILHQCRNSKIILMTGTPMRNFPYDIAYIMNLILPLDMQLPLKEEFQRKITNYKDLIPYFLGRVFYKQALLNITMKFMGVVPSGFKNMVLYTHKTSPLQERTLQRFVYPHTIPYSHFSTIGSYIALFTYPDGSFGERGYNKYIEDTEIFNEYTEEFVNNLGMYSPIYNDIISKAKANPTEKLFVYSRFVKYSGCDLLERLLFINDYRRTLGTETTKNKRYAIVTGDITGDVSKIIQKFNSPENVNGEYIQIFIGSDKIAEGISLMGVLQTHIVTPKWNYGSISQVIARTHRINSHENLPMGYVSKIYQHVVLFENNERNNDLYMYRESELKDINIKRIEQIIKKSSVDCDINLHDWNEHLKVANLKDGCRECNYDKCKYSCFIKSKDTEDLSESMEKLTLEGGYHDEIKSTYMRYYVDKDMILSQIKNLLERNMKNWINKLTVLECIQYFRDDEDINPATVIEVFKSFKEEGIINYNGIITFTGDFKKKVIKSKKTVKKKRLGSIFDNPEYDSIIKNEHGYFGIGVSDENFKIAKSVTDPNIDKRYISTGQNCKTKKITELVMIAHHLHINPPFDEVREFNIKSKHLKSEGINPKILMLNKPELCTLIYNWMIQNNVMIPEEQ